MKILKINPQFYDSLKAIKDYIKSDNEKQAVKVVSEILDLLEQLGHFPDSGQQLSNKVKQKTKYRYITIYSYAVLYYIKNDAVLITDIIHMSRDFGALKLDE